MKQKLGRYKAESMWIGSSWMCRKRRSHYQSFCHNGAVISVSTIPKFAAFTGNGMQVLSFLCFNITSSNAF